MTSKVADSGASDKAEKGAMVISSGVPNPEVAPRASEGDSFKGLPLVSIIIPSVILCFLAILATTVLSVINGITSTDTIMAQLRISSLETIHAKSKAIFMELEADCHALHDVDFITQCAKKNYLDLTASADCMDTTELFLATCAANDAYNFIGIYTVVNGSIMSTVEVIRDATSTNGWTVGYVDQVIPAPDPITHFRYYDVLEMPPHSVVDTSYEWWTVEANYNESAADIDLWYSDPTMNSKGKWTDYVWEGFSTVFTGYYLAVPFNSSELPSGYEANNKAYDLFQNDTFMFPTYGYEPHYLLQCTADSASIQDFFQSLSIAANTKMYMVNIVSEEILAISTSVDDVANWNTSTRYTVSSHPHQWVRDSWTEVKDYVSNTDGETYSSEYGNLGFMKKGGKMVDMSMLALSGAAWAIIMVNDVDDFYGLSISSTEIIISVAIPVFCFACFLLVVISLSITNPIKRLNQAMSALQKLDVENAKVTDASRSKLVREVRSMEESFAAMSVAIRSFSRFAPMTIIEKLVVGGKVAQKEMARRNVTIFFSDMEGFTRLAEKVGPDVLIHMLDEYLTIMSDEITVQGGVIIEYIGDAIMACFNSPDYLDNHASKCAASCINQQRRLDDLNLTWTEQFGGAVKMRIGIHTGDCLQGIFGSRQRLKFGLAGDSVNLCSRVENIGKRYGLYTLCTGELKESTIQANFLFRHMDRIIVKGRLAMTDLYELMNFTSDATSDEKLRAKQWGDMLKVYMEGKWDDALALLDEYEKKHSDLPVAIENLRERIEKYKISPPPENWGGAHKYYNK